MKTYREYLIKEYGQKEAQRILNKQYMFDLKTSLKMTFAEIMKIKISDQRTVALKYNPEAILNSGAELVDKSTRGNELYKIEKQEINKFLEFPKIWFLKMKCPTGRTFIEGVPPDAAEALPEADAMQAVLCGLDYSEYKMLKQEA